MAFTKLLVLNESSINCQGTGGSASWLAQGTVCAPVKYNKGQGHQKHLPCSPVLRRPARASPADKDVGVAHRLQLYSGQKCYIKIKYVTKICSSIS